jgi:tetratricopeptide (TPR) repeat protein
LFGQNIDSLKLALKNAKHDTTRCNILSILAETASDEEWPAYNEELLKLAQKCASTVTTDILKRFYSKHYAVTLNNIGFLAKQQGNIPKSLEYLHNSLKIQEEIMDKKGMANSLINIGAIYLDQKDIPKALEYYHKSLKIQEEIMDKSGIAYSLINIGFTYQKQGNISKALEYYHKSLEIQEEIIDKRGMAASLNNIGFLYQNQGNFQKALEFYHKSLKTQEEIMDKEGTAVSLNNIGDILLKKEKITEAIIYASQSMVAAKELGFPENIKRAASLLKQIYKKQNKFKEAFKMYEIEIQMRDSINNEETQKAAVKKQMQYQYETQARELKNEQDKKDIIAKAELKQREKERNYFITGFALVIILALFIFRSYRQKQKANVLIAHQKKEVEESRKEILDSIHYAKRIQKAHLPTEKQIEKNLNRLHKKV